MRCSQGSKILNSRSTWPMRLAHWYGTLAILCHWLHSRWTNPRNTVIANRSFGERILWIAVHIRDRGKGPVNPDGSPFFPGDFAEPFDESHIICSAKGHWKGKLRNARNARGQPPFEVGSDEQGKARITLQLVQNFGDSRRRALDQIRADHPCSEIDGAYVVLSDLISHHSICRVVEIRIVAVDPNLEYLPDLIFQRQLSNHLGD